MLIIELITPKITSVKKPFDNAVLNKKNLAKKPDKIGIPAIDNKAKVRINAIKGDLFPNPLKCNINSSFLFSVTYNITANAATPAVAYAVA